MTQAELKTVPSGKLFGYCASYFDDDRYWEEFVRRFNPCLTNSVYQTYRRFSIDGPPPFEIVSDLLQEIYVKILKDKCAALQRFRGASEFEAEVYLMHIATSVTIDHLRRQRSLKRRARTESLDKALILEELRSRRVRMISHYTDELAENDVIRILKRAFKGRNRKRNILIFLLHFREGLTPQEIAEIDLFELRPSTVSHILTEMRDKIREEMFVERLS
jgi:RNA polymerase sigma factor (sigma-70 family)